MQDIYFSNIKYLPLKGVLAAVGCDSVSSCTSTVVWSGGAALNCLWCLALIYSLVSVCVSETCPEGEETGSSPPHVLQC